MTGYVTTRYWRAPEILLQWMHYSEKGETIGLLLLLLTIYYVCDIFLYYNAVDIWSVGCVLAELLSGKTLFVGSNCT